MLEGYFDDSGTHEGSRVALLAGFVATAEVWHSLEREWSALLGEFTDYGVTHFHAWECIVGQGEWGRLEMPYRRRMLNEGAKIIARHAVRPIYSGVDLVDWIVVGDIPVKQAFRTPLDLCFSEIIRQVRSWSRAEAKDSPVALIQAEQLEAQTAWRRIYDAYASHPDWVGFLPSLTFALPRNCVPLQTADLLTNALYRDWTRTLQPESRDDLLLVEVPFSEIVTAHGMREGGIHSAQSLRNYA